MTIGHYTTTSYADRSCKIEFFVYDNLGRNWLVEFKTDSGSRRIKQDDYLVEA